MPDPQQQQIPQTGNPPPAQKPPDMDAAEPLNPDQHGGPLGMAAIGMLHGAQEKPPDMEAATPTPPAPSMWDKAKAIGHAFWAGTPVGMAGDVVGIAQEGLAKGAQKLQASELEDAAKGTPTTPFRFPSTMPGADIANEILDYSNARGVSPYKTIGTLALRSASDLAGDVKGLTSPGNIAASAVSMLGRAPRIITGILLAGDGLHNIIQGRGNTVNPNDDTPWILGGGKYTDEELQNMFNSAAEMVGGVALTSEGIQQSARASRAKTLAQKNPEQQWREFNTAIPDSPQAPYERADYDTVRPIIEKTKGWLGKADNAIDNLVGNLNDWIKQAENNVHKILQTNPRQPLMDLEGRQLDVIGEVRQRLQSMDRLKRGFSDEAIKALNEYPILDETNRLPYQNPDGTTNTNWRPPEEIGILDGDELRHTLQMDNDKVRGVNPAVEYGILLRTDPGFAGRAIAAEVLRNSVYEGMKTLGLQDAEAMRQTEGSVIKIRDAAQRQHVSAVNEKEITTGKTSRTKSLAKKAIRGVGTAAGVTVGSQAGHPLAGAVGGSEVGTAVGEALVGPDKITRSALLEKAFEPAPKPFKQPGESQIDLGEHGKVTTASPQGVRAASAANVGRGAAMQNMLHIRGSDGSEYLIPEERLGIAHETDPNLQIIGENFGPEDVPYAPGAAVGVEVPAGHSLVKASDSTMHILPNEGLAEAQKQDPSLQVLQQN